VFSGLRLASRFTAQGTKRKRKETTKKEMNENKNIMSCAFQDLPYLRNQGRPYPMDEQKCAREAKHQAQKDDAVPVARR
jgi:hypothetical protein